jgi:hypothetical protein
MTAILLPFPSDLLRQTAGQLIVDVHKNSLQEALISSKLVRKETPRDDLKRICSNPSTWLSYVFERLESPATKEAALRALSGLVEGALPNLDARVANRLKKARAAAEQNQSERLTREVEGLEVLRKEVIGRNLPSALPMLFLWLKSKHAREQVVQLFDRDAAHMSTPSDEDLTPAQSFQTDPSEDYGLSPLEVLERLRAKAFRRPQSGPDWDVDAVVKSLENVKAKVSIPDFGHLASGASDLAVAVRKVALAGASTKVTIKDLPRLSDWVSKIRQVGKEADHLDAELRDVRRQVSEEIHKAASGCDPSIRPALALIADDVLDAAPIDASLERVAQILADAEAVLRDKVRRIRSICMQIVEGAKTLPESFVVDWNIVRLDVENLRESELTDRLVQIRRQVESEQLRQAGAQRVFSSVEERLRGREDLFDSETMRELQDAAIAGDESSIDKILYKSTYFEKDRSSIVELSGGKMIATLSGAADPALLTYDAEWKVTWKKIPHGFRPRSRFSSPIQPQQDDLLAYLYSNAIEYAKGGSITSCIDFILDIFGLLPSVDQESTLWLNRAVSLMAIVGLSSAVSGYSLGRTAQLISEETSRNARVTPPPALKALFQTSGFDDSVAQLFGHKELLPFTKPLGALLREVAVLESAYLLEDLARGIGKSCLYGYNQTAAELLLSVAEAENVTPEVLSSTRAALELINEQPGKSRATTGPRFFGIPYWLREGVFAYEAAVNSRGRACTRVLEDRAQVFVNIQLPPIVQKGSGFSYTPGTEILDVVLLVTNPPDSANVASWVELLLPMRRNSWLRQDAGYAIGPLAPGDKALVPLKLDVVDPLPKTLALHYEIRVRQAGFSITGIDAGSLTITIAPPRDVVIEEYPGALGLPITLDDKALELSSATVRRAFRELLRSLNSGGVAAILYGRRRRGKTSILRTISEHKQVLGKYVVNFDSKEDRPFRVLDDAVRHFGSVLDAALTKAGLELPSLTEMLSIRPNWSVIQQWLDSAKTAISKPVHVLLLIDEFQKWLSDLHVDARAQLLGIIRGVYNRQGGNLRISIILSGLPSIHEYRKASADFSNAFHNLFEIQKFDQRASEALIRSNESIDFDRRAVELIKFLSGGNPYLINILGNEICRYLRDKNLPYCFRDDVEEVVRGQFDAEESSPIWLFLQYLLKQGEEDFASEIPELPALTDLAWTLGRRGSSRDKVAVMEIEEELRRMNISVDSQVLAAHIERATQCELLVQEGDRYRFESPWLGEWLTISNGGQPVPIESMRDPNLVLNRYRITKQIAHHGISEVWEAVDTQNAQGSVVLKIYPSKGDTNSGVVERESANLSRIRHKAVVACLNRGYDDQRGSVVVLQYAKGETLQDLIRDKSHHSSRLIGPRGDLPAQVEFIEDIAAGLAECHAAGVVHKDIKPSNIIAHCSGGRWSPTIIDFGISSEVDSTSTAPTIGPYTREYAAPERYLNRPRKAPTDIYSLGLVAYELLTGVAPFGDSLSGDWLERRLAGDFVPLKAQRTDVSLRLSELVGRMLTVDPDERPSADTLAGELSRARDDCDWMVFRAGALESTDPEEICEKTFAALMVAPEAERTSAEYLELADLLIEKAASCKRTTCYARQIVQPMLRIELRTNSDHSVLSRFVRNLIGEVPVDEGGRENKRVAIRNVVEFLVETVPTQVLVSSLETLLSSQNDPLIWGLRHDLFFAAAAYTSAELLGGRCESWCITACKKARPLESGLLEAQLWLRRVESMSVSAGADYLAEKKEVDRLVQAQAAHSTLPESARKQDEKIVGEDEKGHLDIDRIDRWGARLRRLYPFIYAVKRVRKEPGKIGATRILSVDGMSLHIKAAPGIKQARIIPALLDQSFCAAANTMLRISIVLPENSTAAQREAAIEVLASDGSLFPGGRET